MTKVCKKCSETKELTAFPKDSGCKDGRRGVCKPCKAASDASYRRANQEEIKAKKAAHYAANRQDIINKVVVSQREYRKTDAGKAAMARANAKATQRKADWKKTPKGRTSNAYHTAKRMSAKLQRTVSWANPKAIKAIYAQAAQLTRDTGVIHHVDHIVPLQGRTVSGFHHESNLQILTASENCSKSNKF